MPIYSLSADKQQDMYTHLIRDIAEKCNDTRDPKVVDALTQEDIYQFTKANPDIPYCELEDEAGIKTPIFDSNTVNRLWQQLSDRDTNHDGKIEKDYLDTDISVTSENDIRAADPARLAELYNQYQDSIFQITITLGDGSSKYCYGFIIDKTQKEDGSWTYYVATDASMADGYYLDETGYALKSLSDDFKIDSASLYASDPEASLAVLKFDSPADLAVCHLSQEDSPEKDSASYVIGRDKDIATISDKNSSSGTSEFPTTKIQTVRTLNDAANYGTPAFNNKGLVSGFLFFKDDEPYNFWHLITASVIADSYSRMRNNNDGSVTYAEWGLLTASYNINDSRRLVLPENTQKLDVGIWVNQVIPDSAAAQAGILPGDVLMDINGNSKPVSRDTPNNEDFLKRYILLSNPKQKYRVTLYRPSIKQTLTVELTPQTQNYKNIPAYQTQNGFNVVDQTAYDLSWRGQTAPETGVWVNSQKKTDKGAPDDSALPSGLSSRDLITALNGTPTPDVATFKKLFEEAKKSGAQINLTVVKTGRSWTYDHVGDTITCVIPAK